MSSNQNPPTLQDVITLAEQLDVQFSGSAHDMAFDLDTIGVWKLEGTYQNSQAGIEIAYGDLVRHRQTLEQVGQI